MSAASSGAPAIGTHFGGAAAAWVNAKPSGEKPNPEFVLNLPRYKGASVLLARANFGCGSSREHAPWALMDFGIRCVISTSFGDIFYNNCCKNGVLPIKV